MTVCTRYSAGWPVNEQCRECGHHALVHPGAGGPMKSCVVCSLLERERELERLIERWTGARI
jgi:hypothetical protein